MAIRNFVLKTQEPSKVLYRFHLHGHTLGFPSQNKTLEYNHTAQQESTAVSLSFEWYNFRCHPQT